MAQHIIIKYNRVQNETFPKENDKWRGNNAFGH